MRVSLNTRETLDNHAFKLTDSGSRGVIHDLANAADVVRLGVERAIGVAELAALSVSGSDAPCAIDRELDAPYRLGYTGGTTGRSKAVTLTTRGELAELSAFLTDLTPDLRRGRNLPACGPHRACLGRLLSSLAHARRRDRWS